MQTRKKLFSHDYFIWVGILAHLALRPISRPVFMTVCQLPLPTWRIISKLQRGYAQRRLAPGLFVKSYSLVHFCWLVLSLALHHFRVSSCISPRARNFNQISGPFHDFWFLVINSKLSTLPTMGQSSNVPFPFLLEPNTVWCWVVAVTDTIAIVFGLATVVLGVIAIIITYNQRMSRTNGMSIPVTTHDWFEY